MAAKEFFENLYQKKWDDVDGIEDRTLKGTHQDVLVWRSVRILNDINKVRCHHGAAGLIPCWELSQAALRYSRLDATATEKTDLVSELKWKGLDDSSKVTVVRDLYEGWKQYDFERPGYSKETNDFTQLVWLASEKLGIGIDLIITKDRLGKDIYALNVVLLFEPARNRKNLKDNEYRNNVCRGKDGKPYEFTD